jgi:hypothetical protein
LRRGSEINLRTNSEAGAQLYMRLPDSDDAYFAPVELDSLILSEVQRHTRRGSVNDPTSARQCWTYSVNRELRPV